VTSTDAVRLTSAKFGGKPLLTNEQMLAELKRLGIEQGGNKAQLAALLAASRSHSPNPDPGPAATTVDWGMEGPEAMKHPLFTVIASDEEEEIYDFTRTEDALDTEEPGLDQVIADLMAEMDSILDDWEEVQSSEEGEEGEEGRCNWVV